MPIIQYSLQNNVVYAFSGNAEAAKQRWRKIREIGFDELMI